MPPWTNEDKILIKTLRLEKGWSVLRMMREFPSRKMKWFLFSAGRSAGTPFTPHCCLPAQLHSHVPKFTEPENWPPNSPDLNPVDYSVWGAATDGVPSKNFRRWPAETRANRLLGSAKPRHVKSSERSATKKSDDGYQGQGCTCWILSRQTMCVNDRCCVIVCWVKIH